MAAVADVGGPDPSGDRPEAPAAPVRVWPAAALLTAFSVVFVARTMFRYRGHVYFALFDDAMISMRYGHNLATGHGLVWNPGQPPVEGYTNPLWTLWMAVLHLVGLPGWLAVLAVLASAVGLTVVGLWLVRAIAGEVWPGDRRRAAAGVWLTALCYPLAFWALRGMEVAALAACASGMVLLVLRGRHGPDGRWLTAVAGVIVVAVLLRTDAVVISVVAIGGAMAFAPTTSDRRRVLLILGGALVGVLAAQTAFRVWYYRDPLPNTYYLKIAGTPLATRLGRGTAATAALATSSLLPMVVAAGVGLVTEVRRCRLAVMLLAAMVLGPASYSVYVGGDAWEWILIANRYQAISLPILCLLAGGGLITALDGSARLRRSTFAGIAAAILVSVALAGRNLPPTGSLQYVLTGTQDLADRTAATLIAAVALIAVALLSRSTRWSVGVAVVAVCLVMDGSPLGSWVRTTGPHVSDDATMALYGLVVRDSTAPTATVAVMWAGGSPYYSGRPSIDLLGKSDRKIAHEPPQPVPFYPGHTKWDYAWSIGHMRPDLVADIFRESPALDAQLRGWGYDNLAPKVWVRRDSTLVDRSALVAALDANPRIGQLVRRHL